MRVINSLSGQVTEEFKIHFLGLIRFSGVALRTGDAREFVKEGCLIAVGVSGIDRMEAIDDVAAITTTRQRGTGFGTTGTVIIMRQHQSNFNPVQPIHGLGQ